MFPYKNKGYIELEMKGELLSSITHNSISETNEEEK